MAQTPRKTKVGLAASTFASFSLLYDWWQVGDPFGGTLVGFVTALAGSILAAVYVRWWYEDWVTADIREVDNV